MCENDSAENIPVTNIERIFRLLNCD